MPLGVTWVDRRQPRLALAARWEFDPAELLGTRPQSDEAHFDSKRDRIISLRQLSTPFISRLFFEEQDSEDLVEVDRLRLAGHSGR
jgi:hypothetical protein